MSDLMEWLLILLVGYNFFSMWIIATTLEKILNTLVEHEIEISKNR
jgi:hypothetical protein